MMVKLLTPPPYDMSTQIANAVRSKRFIQIWVILKIKITALINLC